MKRTLQMMSFLLMGMLILSACTEEKLGKSPDKIVDKIDVDPKEIGEDSIDVDSIVIEDTVALIPPPPPEPCPPNPWPDPRPEPRPGPMPPDPIPEPIPEPFPPMPVQVNPIVDFPDATPIYPGDSPTDSKNMTKFISKNIKYPEIDKELGNQGKVFVEFIVEKDGKLTNIKILRGVSESIDKEARRIIRLMPNWKPGESNGKIVRTRMRLPITFKLE